MMPPPPQALIKRWLEHVLERRQWSPADLARKAGVAPSTIGRALAAEKFVMSTATLAKISAAAGIGIPAEIVGSGAGLAEPEAEPYLGVADAGLEQADNLDNWTIRSRALDLAGYLPGDVVQVSRLVPPAGDDIVLVQIYDIAGGAETAFRQYDPPYVVTRTTDPACLRKPQIVDGQRVVVMGVVTRLVRQRRQ